jgi:hypothetical protein
VIVVDVRAREIVRKNLPGSSGRHPIEKNSKLFRGRVGVRNELRKRSLDHRAVDRRGRLAVLILAGFLNEILHLLHDGIGKSGEVNRERHRVGEIGRHMEQFYHGWWRKSSFFKACGIGENGQESLARPFAQTSYGTISVRCGAHPPPLSNPFPAFKFIGEIGVRWVWEADRAGVRFVNESPK